MVCAGRGRQPRCGRQLILLLALWAGALSAQRLNPVRWSVQLEPAQPVAGKPVLIRLEAKLDEPWHLYSLTTPKGGPIPTSIQVNSPALEQVRIYQPKPERKFDPNFNLDTETFAREVIFLITAQVAAQAGPQGRGEIQVRYQACTDRQCLPPRRVTVPFEFAVASAGAGWQGALPEGYAAVDRPAAEARPGRPATGQGEESLAGYLALAFGFGLAAVFTPCVFPMIPITISYFLNQKTGSRGAAVFQGAVFCLGIIVLFTSIGLGVSALLGPFGVVQLGSNVWVNTFVAAVFLIFGLSLLGAFELTLPSGLVTRLHALSGQGGFVGTLLMGLTFALASFACVGPFFGTLLAGSVQGGGGRAAIGMLAFASGLAAPFFLLAVFPSWLKRLPRSGGWLERVKVVMGFFVLAAMIYKLSAVDRVLQANILTRERFLAAWLALFALAGLYLLGIVRLRGGEAEGAIGVGRLLAGGALLAFALSLIPGMWGARLGELEAYLPPPEGGFLAAGRGGTAEGLTWLKNDYRGALARAREENKLLLVSFTGYACTNCHWMKANMFTRPEVAAALKDFILVELYTDGTDPASEENQRLQESRFQTVAIPFYAILDGEERIIASFAGLTKNVSQFVAFLKTRGEAAS